MKAVKTIVIKDKCVICGEIISSTSRCDGMPSNDHWRAKYKHARVHTKRNIVEFMDTNFVRVN
jgi:hypothetical protein